MLERNVRHVRVRGYRTWLPTPPFALRKLPWKRITLSMETRLPSRKKTLHARTLKLLARVIEHLTPGRRRSTAPAQSNPVHGAAPPVRVLMFPKYGNNPYLRSLAESLEHQGVRVEDFRLDRAFKERYDVVHIHWPDLHLQACSSQRALAKHARLALLFVIFRWRKSRIVWTIHNLTPHERHPRLGELLFPIWFPRLCTHVIALTRHGLESAQEMYPTLRNKAATVIPHGHYRDAYGAAAARAGCRNQLGLAHRFTFLFFGNIRPYKNVPLLIEAFRALPRPDVQLVIAGHPGPMLQLEELKNLAAGDARIHLWPEFVPDEKVPLYVGACDVVVLPFQSILNSGSVFLALSFNRAVLAPRLGSLPEIQSHVGARWVNLYDGPLTPEHLLQTMSAEGIGEHETADLSAYDWDSIGLQTLAFYRGGSATPDASLPAKQVPALPNPR